jgi:hypothetical protein
LDESAEEALPKVAGLSEKKFVHVFPRARLATRKGAAHLDVLALHEEFEKWRVVETREGRLEGTGVAVLWSAPADLVDQESAFLLPEGSPLRDALQALLLILRETPLTPADLGAVLRFALLVARQA